MESSTPSASYATTEVPEYALRDHKAKRYDLIPHCLLRRLADRLQLGAERYGEFNWQRGLSSIDVYNHAIEHLQLALSGRLKPALLDEDHLAAVVCNIAFLMWYEENGNPYEDRDKDRIQRPNAPTNSRKR
jgi:hypothetical protein